MEMTKASARIYAFIALSILTAVSPFSASANLVAESCKAKPVPDSRVAGRANTVTFPNGRAITIVGHIHGDRSFEALAQAVESGKLVAATDDQFNAVLEFLRNKDLMSMDQTLRDFGIPLNSPTATNHAYNDYSYLTDLIRQDTTRQRIQFVGVESNPDFPARQVPRWRTARAVVLAEFHRRARNGTMFFNQAQLETIMLGGMMGNLYSYVANPQLAQHAPIMGFEDPKVTKDSDDIYDQLDKARTLLNRARPAGTADDGWMELLTKLSRGISVMRTEALRTMEADMDRVQREAPEYARPYLPEVLAAIRRVKRVNELRDWAVAKNLTRMQRSGIHFAGFVHFPGLTRYLEHLCTKEANAIRPQVSDEALVLPRGSVTGSANR